VKRSLPAICACQPESRRETCCGMIREDYSDRKLFFGMTLRPQNKASPSSATSAMTWLFRSIDHSLSASDARNAFAAGIMREPGSLAVRASASLPSSAQKHGRVHPGAPSALQRES
jgi:hypothetical protein